MLDVINTIVPVFLVILLGYFLHAKELLPSPIMGPLNRLVFYLAIPAMIFREISRVSFAAYFSPSVLAGTLAPIIMVFLIGLAVQRLLRMPSSFRALFFRVPSTGTLGTSALQSPTISLARKDLRLRAFLRDS